MSWGSALGSAWNKATEKAKAVATATMSGISAAADAVKRAAVTTADAVKRAVVTTAGYVDSGVRIAVDFVRGLSSLGVAYAASLYTKAKRLFVRPPPPVIVCQSKEPVNVWTPEYRQSLRNTAFSGQDNPALGKAMQALRRPLTDQEAEPHLQTIAELRNRPIDEIREEYAKYTKRRRVQNKMIEIYHEEPIDELKAEQKDFMGSKWQLRYGKVVGDDLGMDPVFGAMLNPTGGLVGRGNEGVHPDAGWMAESIGHHGGFHDAAGYLYNYQGKGDGYNYTKAPMGLDTSNPWGGQGGGIIEASLISLRT